MLTYVNHNIGLKILIFLQGDKVSSLGVYHQLFTICVKSAGKTELEDLQEGSDEGSGWSVLRWLGLIFGVLLVICGCCCAIKLFGVFAPNR